MKKLLFPLSILLSCTVTQAQPILLPNGDFENWSSVSYDNPDKWDNSNLYTIPNYGFANVSKVTGTSGSTYAIRLETKVSGTDTIAAYFSNSDDPITGDGGVPYTVQATQFHGYYRYNVASGDTAWIILKFKNNGNIISDTMYPITGSQSTFTAFNFPIPDMSQAPDTLILAAVSGNVINGTPKAGSWLELDGLSFSDNIMWVLFQDGDFEDWTTSSYYAAADWSNEGFGEVSRTTDKFSGTYAAKLVSNDDGTGYVEEASLILQSSSSSILGMPYTKLTDTLTGYYKYSTTGNDNAILYATLTDASVMPIAPASTLSLAPVSVYTYFELPLSSSVAPGRLVVEIASSDYSGTPVDGSTLYIDNLRLKNTPTGIDGLADGQQAFTVFPNPARDVLYIKPGKRTANAATLHIYDMAGRIAGKHELKSNLGGIMQVQLSGYVPGVYQYEIQSSDAVTRGKFIKE